MGCGATALVSSIFTGVERYTPYQRPPDAATLRSAIPRGLKSFVVTGNTLPAKPINDTHLVTFSFTLPGGFGYIFNEFQINLQCDRAQDFEDEGEWRLSQTSLANEGFDYRFPVPFITHSQNGTDLGVKGTRSIPGTYTRTPIVPRGTGATQTFHFSDLQAAAAAAGNIDCLCSFWEYDLEQLAWFYAHSAANVATR